MSYSYTARTKATRNLLKPLFYQHGSAYSVWLSASGLTCNCVHASDLADYRTQFVRTTHPLHHINHNPQCTPPPTHCTTSTTIHNAHHLPPTALHSNKSPCTPPPIHQPLTTISSLLTETSRAPKLPLTLKQLCTHVVGVTFLLTQSIATIETSRAPKLRLTIKQPSTHVVLTALQQTRIRTKFRLTTHN